MPHVEIKCYSGRSDELKRECAYKVAEAIAATFGCSKSSVSVAIKDFPKEEWKEKVWDVNIAPEMDRLYKKPEYSMS
ncbi:tautomerase family protein [Treponema sp.]|uniref:tautomerase family protein n=1 Tax=Treponema sp. TaxID=166 RepID=UPI00388F9E4F